MQGDGLVAQLLHEVGPPVPLQARGIERVEGALQHGMGHGVNAVQCGRAEFPYGLEDPFGLLLRPRIAPDHAAHLLEVQILRKGGSGGDRQEREEAVQIVWGRGDELPVPFHDVGGLLESPERRAADNGLDGMEPEEEGGDSAEIADRDGIEPPAPGFSVLARHSS